MPCASQTFQNITQSQFDCLTAKAAGAGISIAGPSGQATTNGVTVIWDFDAVSGTLVMQCTDAPFFIPCAMIEGKIKDIVEGCVE